jgi:hypothetical protein
MIAAFAFLSLLSHARADPSAPRALYMRQVACASDANFNLVGAESPDSTPIYSIVTTGFYTSLTVGATTANAVKSQALIVGGIQLETSIATIGAAAVLAFKLINLNDFPTQARVAVWGDLYLNGRDDPACYDIGSGRGFIVRDDGPVQFRFHVRDHALVTDVTTYWFGAYSALASHRWSQSSAESFSGGDSVMAFSWQHLTLDNGAAKILTAVIAVGPDALPPSLTITSPVPSVVYSALSIAGAATDPEGLNLTVVAVVDGEVARPARLATDVPSGAELLRWQTATTWSPFARLAFQGRSPRRSLLPSGSSPRHHCPVRPHSQFRPPSERSPCAHRKALRGRRRPPRKRRRRRQRRPPSISWTRTFRRPATTFS